MKSKITTDIDQVDNIKFRRLAERAGMSVNDAARIIYVNGVEFFLTRVVGATKQ